MAQILDDKYLSTALRQAANKLNAQRKEIISLTAATLPVDDCISIYDFIPLIKKAKSNAQIKAILDLVDAINADDSSLIVKNDWVFLSRLLQQCKKEI